MPGVVATRPLAGALVRLEPLGRHHADALTAAAGEDRRTYRYTAVPEGDEGVGRYVAELLADHAAGRSISFAQIRVADGQPVGVTRFLNIRTLPGGVVPFALEIGGTWLAASAQGTGVNTEAKLLLLEEAFGSWGVGRADFKTDARNERARAALAALGASFEGTLRCWQPSRVAGEEGQLRDTAMYSIVAPEWPAVRRRLAARVARAAERAHARGGAGPSSLPKSKLTTDDTSRS
ncbi:MAG TPA: GNAT family protein [Acidimicrobiales bacterium]|nr:GNAT family protein [Acidimicrobiales bacterium]